MTERRFSRRSYIAEDGARCPVAWTVPQEQDANYVCHAAEAKFGLPSGDFAEVAMSFDAASRHDVRLLTEEVAKEHFLNSKALLTTESQRSAHEAVVRALGWA